MDNGGESANDEMWGLGNQYGINIKQTAAYSPWANGLNERNYDTIDIMMKKYLTIFLMLMKIQLFSMYLSVSNCYLYVLGFTPTQLALG